MHQREFKGQQKQQDQEPLRGKSASERVSERGFQRFFRGSQRFFRGSFLKVLSETLPRARFPSQRLSVLFPLVVSPLELSPKVQKKGTRECRLVGRRYRTPPPAKFHTKTPSKNPYLVNLFLTNLVRISGFSSLFSAIAVFLALSGRMC